MSVEEAWESESDYLEKVQQEIDSLTGGFTPEEAAWLVDWLASMVKDLEFRANERVRIKMDVLTHHAKESGPYYEGVNYRDFHLIFDRTKKIFPPKIEKHLQSFLQSAFHTPENLYKWLRIIDDKGKLTLEAAEYLHRLAVNLSPE